MKADVVPIVILMIMMTLMADRGAAYSAGDTMCKSKRVRIYEQGRIYNRALTLQGV